jgi:hypothetical protein
LAQALIRSAGALAIATNAAPLCVTWYQVRSNPSISDVQE